MQLIWLATRQRLAAVDIKLICLYNSTTITPSISVRNLVVIFDSELSMAQHVSGITRACFYELRQLRFMRHLLFSDAKKMMAHAFISIRVDYCNLLLYDNTTHLLRRLQAMIDTAVPLICGLGRNDHIIKR